MTIVVRLLVRAEERRVAIGVVWSILVVISFVWLWGVAYMQFPTADKLINEVISSISSETAMAAPSVEPASSRPTVPDKGARSEDTAENATSVTSTAKDERLWGEGTPRGPRGHLTNRR